MSASQQETSFGLTKRETGDLLRSHGINPTTQRVEIAHFLLQKPQHVCADMILCALNKDFECVSQATVYNTLKLLVDKGVVNELIFASDRIYYDSRIDHHHHFVDVDSGEIIDLPGEAVQFPGLEQEIGESEILSTSVILKGRRRSKTGKHSSEDQQLCSEVKESDKKRSALKSRKL